MSQTPVKRLNKVPPIILKKNALKIGTSQSDYNFLLRCVKNSPQLRVMEDVIYRSTNDDFLKGKYPELVLINRLNLMQNSSQTIATYIENSVNIKLTSDAVVRIIGQKNYDTVFSVLCSTISLESRVLGILALLSRDKIRETVSTSAQTIESSAEVLKKQKLQRVRRKKVRPYIITDHLMETKPQKKIIVNPADIDLFEATNSQVGKTETIEDNNSINNKSDSGLPDIQHLINEDSNISNTSISNISLNSCDIPAIIDHTKSLLTYIEDHTIPQFAEKTITMIDGSTITIKGNPDNLHLTTPDILSQLTLEQRKRLLWHQTYLDWKLCLQRDADFNLPLHWAVVNDDIPVLKRQCAMLKTRNQSVDITAAGNMTALQMSLADSSVKCTELLLQHGADVLATDEQTRTALHLAAERDEHHTNAVLEHCRTKARLILKDNEELWEEGFEEKSDDALGQYLLNKINVMCDDEGYTPLMLASKAGKHKIVKLLVESAPYIVNHSKPTCGNTALYLAITEACVDATNSENQSKIDENFMKTISYLVENGADPSIVNNYGSSVNDLLNEFNFSDLSMLIANKLTSIKYMGGKNVLDFSSYMLVKNACGEVNFTEVRDSLKVKKPEKTYQFKKHLDNDTKNKIIEKKTEPDSEKHIETETNSSAVTDRVQFKRSKAIKSNSKQHIKPMAAGANLKECTTIYKTVPVVKASYVNKNDKNVKKAPLEDKHISGKLDVSDPEIKPGGILLNKSLQLNIPVLNKPVKISPVSLKRAPSGPQGGPSTKINKRIITQKILIIKK